MKNKNLIKGINLLKSKKSKLVFLSIGGMIATYLMFKLFAYDYNVTGYMMFRTNKITEITCRRSAVSPDSKWICPIKPEIMLTPTPTKDPFIE